MFAVTLLLAVALVFATVITTVALLIVEANQEQGLSWDLASYTLAYMALFGAAHLTIRRFAPYAEADLTRQAEQLPRLLGFRGETLLRDVDLYVAGINAYVAGLDRAGGVFRLTTTAGDEVDAMINRTRLGRLLAGYRGVIPPTDLDGLKHIVRRLGQLAQDMSGLLVEGDLNPVMVTPGSGRSVVVDALFVTVPRD